MSLAALATVDRLTPAARVQADALWAPTVFREFRPYRSESRSRGANENARVELRGLWASTPTRVSLEVSSPAQPRRIRFFGHGRPLLERRLDEAFEVVPLDAVTNEDGSLSLRFTGVRSEGTALRVASLAVTQQAGSIPRARLILYALFGPSLLVLVTRLSPGPAPALWSLGLGVLGVAGAIHFARLPAMIVYPWLAGGMALSAGALLVADVLTARAGLPASAARWVAAASVFQLALVATPRFGMIDAPWHMRNLWTFAADGLTVSTAPGLEHVPYPPAFYALLSPWATGRPEVDLYLVRFGMTLLQAASPLLVFALMRAGGASAGSAAAGATAAAVMPEALLVLAKGIAANIFGGFMALLVLIALLRQASMAVVTALLAVACLGHAPAAAALGMLLPLWWMDQWRRGDLDRFGVLARLGALATAAGLAWLAYYREAPLVFAPTGVPTNPVVGEIRWYRAGKILQDTVLKFGLIPLVLAAVGWARAKVPDALRGLLRCWFTVGLALALTAVFSPFPLRFEYFLLPAVAIAAGLGAEHLVLSGSHASAATMAWVAAFAVQVLLGVLLLQDRFEIISVIMESPRWPFPFKL